jgi:hypothetical protein
VCVLFGGRKAQKPVEINSRPNDVRLGWREEEEENCNFHFAFMFSLTLKGENIKLSMIKQKNAASSNWPNNLKVEKE